MSTSPKTDKTRAIKADAKGQFAPTQAGGHNNGVADAKPRVINPSEDATIHNRSPEPLNEGKSKDVGGSN
ncbi:hypothetical protein ABID16_003381 [Rhizobium aquaticum]|uniref:Uncharacterized protein n=1 Tax=Rhizobium aquaticum TaxID=1549636 RepID=A0ABV2J2S9_9HYPH